jgi:hypothetical protein
MKTGLRHFNSHTEKLSANSGERRGRPSVLTITLMSLASHEHQEDHNHELLFAFI